jgi:hypothetical protein
MRRRFTTRIAAVGADEPGALARVEVEGDTVQDGVIPEGFVDLVGCKHMRPVGENKNRGQCSTVGAGYGGIAVRGKQCPERTEFTGRYQTMEENPFGGTKLILSRFRTARRAWNGLGFMALWKIPIERR